jgi:hypothetical protein
MSSTVATCGAGLRNDLNEQSLRVLVGELVRPALTSTASPQRILAVNFRASDGRSWSAIGGGDTVAAAIDWARECCPDDTTWELAG